MCNTLILQASNQEMNRKHENLRESKPLDMHNFLWKEVNQEDSELKMFSFMLRTDPCDKRIKEHFDLDMCESGKS
jgi:hypothetical protein